MAPLHSNASSAPWPLERAAAVGALAGLLHAIVAALIMALAYREHILPPPAMGHGEFFDGLSKLLGIVLVHDFPGAFLQRFYGPGLFAKLPLVAELALVNVPLGATLGILAGALACVAARLAPALGGGLGVSLGYLGGAAALHAGALAPWILDARRSRSLRHAMNETLRHLVSDGALADLLLTAVVLAGALWVVGRVGSRPSLRASCAACCLALVGIVFGGASTPGDAVGAIAPTTTTRAVRPRHVVMVSIDSLRADHLHCYGYDRPTSPALDRLAAGGVRFAAAHTVSSWTLPSHATMLTGLHPLSHGAVTAERRIAPDAPMLPAELRRAGFATGGFVSYEFLRRRYGFDVGFDHYDDFTTDRDTEKEERSERMGPLLNAEIIPWIARHAERPFFLFIHYYDVHWNYDPPPPFDTMFDPDYAGPDLRPFLDNPAIHRDMPARHLAHLLSLYDGEIRFTDGVVGEVIAALERGGIADDTLLLITADHGDEFFEHGGIGHSRTLYDEVVRVPLIARWPNGLPAGHVVETPVSLVDLAPTVYDLVGVTAPAGIEGRSLAPLMLGAPAPARPVYAHLAGRKRQNNWTMVRDGDAKYLAQTRAPHTELYDVGADPREGDDRFAARAMRETRDERAGQLLAWLEQQWDAYAARPARAGRIVIDDRNTEKLRALGYVE